VTSGSIFICIYTNQTKSWLVHSLSTNEPRDRTHKTHHDPLLREATTFPLVVSFFYQPWGLHPNVIFPGTRLQCNSLKSQTCLTTYICMICINDSIEDPFSTHLQLYN
jgi:hypothetical protein